MESLQYLEDYKVLFSRACERKGGPDAVEALLGRPNLSTGELTSLGDDRYLAAFTQKVFQSGFVWRVVEQKWAAFEEVFFGFDVDKVLLMPDEMLERKATDPAIIRNFKKVQTIRDNALMIKDVQRRGTSFAEFVAQWPEDDIVGLWSYLKTRGSRLGGNTGAYALRALGKDTFILSEDVVGYFKARGIITGGVTSKRSLTAIQSCFNQLRQQSDRSLREISRIIAMGVGDNWLQIDSD